MQTERVKKNQGTGLHNWVDANDNTSGRKRAGLNSQFYHLRQGDHDSGLVLSTLTLKFLIAALALLQFKKCKILHKAKTPLFLFLSWYLGNQGQFQFLLFPFSPKHSSFVDSAFLHLKPAPDSPQFL